MSAGAKPYTTRRGASRRRTHTTRYADLLHLPTRERPDDGTTILHVGDHSPMCVDCGRGRLQWAEAGYVPWHRICDMCGSHWDLHPLELAYLAGYPVIWRDTGWAQIDPEALIGDGYTDEGPRRPWRELLDLVTEAQLEAATTEREKTYGVSCVPACWARRARFYGP